MPVGLSDLPTIYPVPGIRLGTARAGIRKKDRRDLVLIDCSEGTTAAAVFTQNRFCAAPVVVAREHLSASPPRALLINTGFANAGTGAIGIADARQCCDSLAASLGCRSNEVLPFSTGVIGERLPIDRVTAGIPAAVDALSEHGWSEAAHGIMTTDTVAKAVSRQIDLGGRTVTISGIAKGSGMIRPDMATLLSFVATDAAISAQALDQMLHESVDKSFNCITVDGDTSTNDALVLLATGRAGNAAVQASDDPGYLQVQEVLTEICLGLAQQIVRDGEGATKFMTITVTGADTANDAREVAFTVAHSPLVKTAFFASDPNWGRILAAVGRAPVSRLDVTRVSIHLNEVCVVQGGALDPAYREELGVAVMREPEITVRIDLGAGRQSATVWTTDLSHDYVRINAEYRS